MTTFIMGLALAAQTALAWYYASRLQRVKEAMNVPWDMSAEMLINKIVELRVYQEMRRRDYQA